MIRPVARLGDRQRAPHQRLGLRIAVRGEEQSGEIVEAYRHIGTVTVSDISLHLQALTEPFLCLREIELHVRNLIGSKFNSDDLSVLAEAPMTTRKPQGIADLTFGEYVRLLENPATWEKVQLQIDKNELTKLLEEVRVIRNDVMHFDPDPMTHDELGTLKRAVRFMQELYELFQ